MAEEIAKNDFNNILNSIDRKFDIIHLKWTGSKNFEIKIRTQIPRNNDDFNALCDEWVDLFSEVTNTVWAKKISNTGPKIRFRKQYQCWTHGGKVIQKELLFDARKCKGTLDMKVLTDNPLTRKKNKHLKLGLNVVVKINFNHLHPVNTSESFSFFVHNCEPLSELPPVPIQPNDRLSQLVAEMVEKGRNTVPKIPPLLVTAKDIDVKNNDNEPIQPTILQDNLIDSVLEEQEHLLQDPLQIQNISPQTIQLIQNVPLQSLDGVKLEIQPQLQPYTQVVVSSPQLDMTSNVSEHLLMCPPLMFDTSQVIGVSTHSLPSHFVQVHSPNVFNQSQYL